MMMSSSCSNDSEASEHNVEYYLEEYGVKKNWSGLFKSDIYEQTKERQKQYVDATKVALKAAQKVGKSLKALRNLYEKNYKKYGNLNWDVFLKRKEIAKTNKKYLGIQSYGQIYRYIKIYDYGDDFIKFWIKSGRMPGCTTALKVYNEHVKQKKKSYDESIYEKIMEQNRKRGRNRYKKKKSSKTKTKKSLKSTTKKSNKNKNKNDAPKPKTKRRRARRNKPKNIETTEPLNDENENNKPRKRRRRPLRNKSNSKKKKTKQSDLINDGDETHDICNENGIRETADPNIKDEFIKTDFDMDKFHKQCSKKTSGHCDVCQNIINSITLVGVSKRNHPLFRAHLSCLHIGLKNGIIYYQVPSSSDVINEEDLTAEFLEKIEFVDRICLKNNGIICNNNNHNNNNANNNDDDEESDDQYDEYNDSVASTMYFFVRIKEKKKQIHTRATNEKKTNN